MAGIGPVDPSGVDGAHSEHGRPVGLTQDVGYEIGASATLPFPVARVWAFLTSSDGTALWLAPGTTLPTAVGAVWTGSDGSRGQLRGLTAQRRLRTTLLRPGRPHPTTAQVTTTDAPGGRTVLRFHEENLLDGAERRTRREHYRAALTAVQEALDAQ